MIKIRKNPEYDKIITQLKAFAKKLDKLIEEYELYDSAGFDITIEFNIDKNSKTLSISPFWIALTTDNRATIEEDKIIDYLNQITPIDATFVFYDGEEELIFEHKVTSNKDRKLYDFFEGNNINHDFTLVYMPCVNEVFLQRGAIRYDTPEYYSIKKLLIHFNKLLA